jgi:hypothetical protein
MYTIAGFIGHFQDFPGISRASWDFPELSGEFAGENAR